MKNNMYMDMVESLKDEIVSRIKISIKTESNKYQKNEDIKNRKNIFESISVNVVKNVLRENIPGVEIIDKSPSRYPEIEFKILDKLYAIDIKTSYSDNNPAFDLAYFSKYEQEMHNKYEQDWVIAIKHLKDEKTEDSVDQIFFNRLYELVNLKKNGLITNGGHAVKVRPISWKNMKSENFKIESREMLLQKINETLVTLLKNKKYKKVIEKQLSNFHKKENNRIRNNRMKDSIDEYVAVIQIFKKYKNLDIKKMAKLMLV